MAATEKKGNIKRPRVKRLSSFSWRATFYFLFLEALFLSFPGASNKERNECPPSDRELIDSVTIHLMRPQTDIYRGQ